MAFCSQLSQGFLSQAIQLPSRKLEKNSSLVKKNKLHFIFKKKEKIKNNLLPIHSLLFEMHRVTNSCN